MLRCVIVAALLLGEGAAAQADSIEDKAQLCAACHGEKGIPMDPTIPIIWGQTEGYLHIELRDFQKGARKSKRMTPIAQSLSRKDAEALAAYFAAKHWPKTGAPQASKADEATATSAIKSVVCTSCHREQFRGDSAIPRLAGQTHEYLARTMDDFRDGARGNNPGMSGLMKTVTPEQIAALASYLAGF